MVLNKLPNPFWVDMKRYSVKQITRGQRRDENQLDPDHSVDEVFLPRYLSILFDLPYQWPANKESAQYKKDSYGLVTKASAEDPKVERRRPKGGRCVDKSRQHQV